MSCTSSILKFKQGQSFSFTTTPNTDLDFSIYSKIRIEVRKIADATIILAASLADSEITIDSPPTSITVEGPIFPLDTEVGTYLFDIRMETAGGQVDYTETEKVKVIENITEDV